jgi:hypothetical protein
MINFFRKTRKKLADDNKFLKYSRYAIGEIALVVIGILIALSINNWNEERKLKVQEINILHNFQESLQADLQIFKLSIDQHKRVIKSINFLLNYMERDLVYQDSLKYHFGNTTHIWQFNVDEGVFESLKSKDLNLISNEGLRRKLLYLYGSAREAMARGQDKYRDMLDDAATNLFNTRFESFWETNYVNWKIENNYESGGYNPSSLIATMVPIDYNSLKMDQEYLYFLKSLKNRYNWLLEFSSENMVFAINEILQDIAEELEILEN